MISVHDAGLAGAHGTCAGPPKVLPVPVAAAGWIIGGLPANTGG